MKAYAVFAIATVVSMPIVVTGFFTQNFLGVIGALVFSSYIWMFVYWLLVSWGDTEK